MKKNSLCRFSGQSKFSQKLFVSNIIDKKCQNGIIFGCMEIFGKYFATKCKTFFALFETSCKVMRKKAWQIIFKIRKAKVLSQSLFSPFTPFCFPSPIVSLKPFLLHGSFFYFVLFLRYVFICIFFIMIVVYRMECTNVLQTSPIILIAVAQQRVIQGFKTEVRIQKSEPTL